MGRKIKLTESQLVDMIERIVKEQEGVAPVAPPQEGGKFDGFPEEWMDYLEDETGLERSGTFPTEVPDVDMSDNAPPVRPTQAPVTPQGVTPQGVTPQGVTPQGVTPQGAPSPSPSPGTAPAPVKTPTPTKPRRQDPFKVPSIKPGEEPAPKAQGKEKMAPVSITESQLTGIVSRMVRQSKRK